MSGIDFLGTNIYLLFFVMLFLICFDFLDRVDPTVLCPVYHSYGLMFISLCQIGEGVWGLDA